MSVSQLFTCYLRIIMFEFCKLRAVWFLSTQGLPSENTAQPQHHQWQAHYPASKSKGYGAADSSCYRTIHIFLLCLAQCAEGFSGCFINYQLRQTQELLSNIALTVSTAQGSNSPCRSFPSWSNNDTKFHFDWTITQKTKQNLKNFTHLYSVCCLPFIRESQAVAST